MSEPYKFKLRTPERGQAWESVAQQLNSTHQPIFRSVRDRFSLLSTKYAHKLRMEEKASGIAFNRAPVAHLVVHRAVTREVVSSRLRPDQHSGS